MSDTLVELTDVSFSYRLRNADTGEAEGSVPILKNINLKIDAGEMVAIQGPSGSGKSTFLYILGCLLRPDRGRVRIENQDIALMDDEKLAILRNRSIGFVFQQFHLLPRATVLDNILLPSVYPVEFSLVTPRDRKRATELAKTLGLDSRLEHVPNQLSGGQQQRVAIARALMRDTKLILADEPTGNLDSKTSAQTMEILKDLNRQGKTVVIITHDPTISRQCPRILNIVDGQIVGETAGEKIIGKPIGEKSEFDVAVSEADARPIKTNSWPPIRGYVSMGFKLAPQAFENLRRNKTRSALTMLGVVIGVAAVLAMVTLGQFTKERVLDSYADLGVNTLSFSGRQNWRLKATDIVPVVFKSFDWERDLVPLFRIFPEIHRMSPALVSWNVTATYGGRSLDQDVRVLGVGSDMFSITARNAIVGTTFSKMHVQNRSSVCVIGYEVAQRLFVQTSPIGKVLYVSNDENSYGCRVIGVLEGQTSNKEWMKPNLQIILPYTFFQGVNSRPWEKQIADVLIELSDGTDIENTGKGIEKFFDMKYGKSGRFRVSSDSKLISQMHRFLNLFTVMLASIALTCLAVGGIGITNMMLVSVSERLKEIGLRKALGATALSIRVQFLVESVILCLAAGGLGVLLGFTLYQSVIYGASKFAPNVAFAWVFDPGAILLSFVSILVVGVASGMAPAVKAEKLQVIEALRSE